MLVPAPLLCLPGCPAAASCQSWLPPACAAFAAADSPQHRLCWQQQQLPAALPGASLSLQEQKLLLHDILGHFSAHAPQDSALGLPQVALPPGNAAAFAHDLLPPASSNAGKCIHSLAVPFER